MPELTEREQVYWRRLAPDLAKAGVLTAWDIDALRDYCIIRARKDAADADIAQRGILVAGRDGQLVRNPAVMISQGASLEAARIGARFGLSPSDRAGLFVPRDDEPKRGLAEFL
ncbi:phage terminase small subunit P27 family [Salinibacterium sp. ZJ450]|uniref:phage terminase small subunit P27 family n=1 Tax=Salinibacterium sp. ZJ450 TaxID=2708338 RepID=UPI001421F806|nr:phage terminase small subunit P27 family [Salinibacterium sp. ZJ450]